jgi:hypothetical protein
MMYYYKHTNGPHNTKKKIRHVFLNFRNRDTCLNTHDTQDVHCKSHPRHSSGTAVAVRSNQPVCLPVSQPEIIHTPRKYPEFQRSHVPGKNKTRSLSPRTGSQRQLWYHFRGSRWYELISFQRCTVDSKERPITLMTDFAGFQEFVQAHSGLARGHERVFSNPYPLKSSLFSDLRRWGIKIAGDTAE